VYGIAQWWSIRGCINICTAVSLLHVLSWPREERRKIGIARRRREAVPDDNFLCEMFFYKNVVNDCRRSIVNGKLFRE
jgi:hypothetical protein